MSKDVFAPARCLLESGEPPGFIGAWLDLAIDEESSRRPQLWTLEALRERWAPDWDEPAVQVWLGRAVELKVFESLEDGVWRLTPGFRLWEVEDAVPTGSTGTAEESVSPDAGNRIEVGPASITFDLQRLPSVRQLERAYINHIIRFCADNKRRAARVLRIDPSTLHRKLRRWAEV